MKKILNLWLVAALTLGLGLSVTSCKDDDDDSKSEEQQQQEQEERASKFWSVVGQLVSSDDYAADYEDKTFEPTYGIADATNETTRIVETNDMQTAAQRFSDLVGASIDENTPSYTYSDPEVGTLTYTRGGTADDWATVDVSIKQVPHLRKIIYREGGEGTNTAFAGKAYYRFGDVVSRQNDDHQTEYWICVRPAFGPEKTSTSFWVCLNTLPKKNQYYVKGSNGTEYYVPTGIGTNKDIMQYLAEMLYAITHPDTWHTNADTYHTDGKYWGYSGMPIFGDWKKANLMYHNQYFWQNVANAWEKNDISDKAMGVPYLSILAERVESEGVNLLYNGYSWWTKTSWNCTLYQASYTNGTKNSEKNLHHAEYTAVKNDVRNIDLDCREIAGNIEKCYQFFNDYKLRWVVRFATGTELNGGTKPAPTAQLQGGCHDVYRYYDEYKNEWDQKGPNGEEGPEVTLKPAEKLQEPKIGAIIGTDGNFYNNMADAKRATNGEDAVGIVVCLNGDRRVEKGQDWNGLAILLKSVEGKTFGVSYGNCDDEARMYDGINDKMGYIEKNVNGHRERFYLADELNGLYYTQYYSNGCGKGHRHPVAQACNYDVFPNNAAFSKAFMPSAGQFILAMKGLGIGWDFMHGFHNTTWAGRDAAEEAEQLEHAKAILQDSGSGISDKDIFLTTTQANDYSQVAFQFNYEMRANGLYFVEWSMPIATRPFIAFKYNGGATED